MKVWAVIRDSQGISVHQADVEEVVIIHHTRENGDTEIRTLGSQMVFMSKEDALVKAEELLDVFDADLQSQVEKLQQNRDRLRH